MTKCSFLLNLYFVNKGFLFSCYQHPHVKSHLGNINNHFIFSPNAGSNITRLLLASRFDYAGGLDKIWDYKLLVYITDDNLLSGRMKSKAFVETGTVTLSIKVIPYPTTIVTTAPVVRA
jgi:cadherin-related family protein 3